MFLALKELVYMLKLIQKSLWANIYIYIICIRYILLYIVYIVGTFIFDRHQRFREKMLEYRMISNRTFCSLENF